MEFYQISITHSKPIIVCYIIMHGKRRTEEQEGREWSGRAAGSQCFTQFSILSQSCSPLEKGRTKGAGWIDGICTNPPLRRYRFFEADSFPRLWPPFGLKEQRQTLAAARQPTHPKGKRLTAFSVACGSLRMQFAAHRWRGPHDLGQSTKGRRFNVQ